MLVGQPGLDQWAETGVWKGFAPVALVEARGIALVGRDDGGELGHPVHRLIAHVPHQSQLAARPQHAVEFVQGFAGGKPVEGLCTDHGIQRAGRQRNGLCRARHGAHRGQLQGFDLGAHGVHGLHAHHRGPGGCEQRGELAGARAHIGHLATGAQSQRLCQPGRQRRRVVRPAARVGLRFFFKTLLCRFVHGVLCVLHHHDLTFRTSIRC